jgi:translation initiation factor 5A
MTDDGTTKDDVKLPEGEVGDKITKLFKTEEKDTSKTVGRLLRTGRLT